MEFRHPLIRAALYDEMPAPVRAAWHRDAGRALAEAGAPADRVARQLLRAVGEPEGLPGPMDEWMLDWLARTADSLVDQAPGVAAELLTRAVAGSPAGTVRHSWLSSRLADALYRMGDTAAAEQVASLALEYATEPDVVEDLHWTLAQCRMLAGPAAESLAALDRALAAPGISARHRARLLVLAARTHLHLGEVEEAGRVAASALEAATEAADNWAMAWALHVLTIMTGVQGHLADTLPLFDRALAVTQADRGADRPAAAAADQPGRHPRPTWTGTTRRWPRPGRPGSWPARSARRCGGPRRTAPSASCCSRPGAGTTRWPR